MKHSILYSVTWGHYSSIHSDLSFVYFFSHQTNEVLGPNSASGESLLIGPSARQRGRSVSPLKKFSTKNCQLAEARRKFYLTTEEISILSSPLLLYLGTFTTSLIH